MNRLNNDFIEAQYTLIYDTAPDDHWIAYEWFVRDICGKKQGVIRSDSKTSWRLLPEDSYLKQVEDSYLKQVEDSASHTTAHESTATVASFRIWLG